MKRLLAATALSLVLATPGFARETFALLVGVSQYDNLEEKYWLKGPANDIDLVQQYLLSNPVMAFAPERMTVLADGVPGAGRPTLAAIRAAFAELTAQVQPGDFVYLHFAGHGTQAPAADAAAEYDGLDEVFLPIDIGPWSDTAGHVENALVDDEIGALIDALRAKGADVWAVFDSCHSGTVTRAAPTSDDDETAMRQLPPEALGVPPELLDEAESATRALPDPRARPEAPVPVAEPAGMGSLVAFFAAQTNETTPEKRLPKGAPERRSQGVFTYTIFETLAEHPGITYRQLGQEVLRKYSVFNLTRTTPMFEGDLDAVVFGAAGTGRVQQWPAQVKGAAVEIAAGTLHGLGVGMRLAVLASPADATEDALGYVTVTKADIFTAAATAEGMAAEIPKGAYLRKAAEDIDFTLTVALPEPGTAPAAALEAALAGLDAGRRVRFVPPGAEADLRLAVLPDSPRPDAIWVLPSSGVIAETDYTATPSVSTADKTPAELATAMEDLFRDIAKALNLMKIGAAAGGDGVKVSAELRRSRIDPVAEELIEGTRQVLDSSNVPRLIPDDVVGVRLTNEAETPVDFNVLYVAADYSIGWMGNGRLNPGETLDDDYVWIKATAFGRDRLVVVLSPAAPGTEVEDLSFLEQKVEITRSTEGGTDMEELLAEAGFGETTRAGVGLKKKKDKGQGPMILQFELDTVPGEEG